MAKIRNPIFLETGSFWPRAISWRLTGLRPLPKNYLSKFVCSRNFHVKIDLFFKSPFTSSHGQKDTLTDTHPPIYLRAGKKWPMKSLEPSMLSSKMNTLKGFQGRTRFMFLLYRNGIQKVKPIIKPRSPI